MSSAEYKERIKWFQQDRFGMFIHWGLYSIPARQEWLRSVEKISVEDYQIYFDEFNPVDYDPGKWAATAKKAGMKYAVLTSKHHDGFCLFDSKLTDYKSTNTPCKRDLVREFVDAFRKEGIKVGLYYSLLDWYHPDYPHYGDQQHPMRNNEEYKNANHNFDNYLDYMHGQIKELCTNYGKLDILWFDFSYGNLTGEAWRATELVNMVRSLQPGILIDNRLEASGEGFGSLMDDNPSVYSGDFVSPEFIIPPEGIRKPNGEPVCWESCITMNNHWCYNQFDNDYKSAKMIIRKLVECVSKGGNLLLNVGPDAKGRIPVECESILEEVGSWLAMNAESVYGCGISGLDKPDYGMITSKDNLIYIHVLEPTIGPIPVKGISKEDIKRIRLLKNGAELRTAHTFATVNYPDYVFVSLGEHALNTYPLPDEKDTVVKIELKNK